MAHKQVTVNPTALREFRRLCGFSQASLGAAIGLGPGSSLIALIETGRRQPGLGNALAIARALDVPLAAFAEAHVDLTDVVREDVAS